MASEFRFRPHAHGLAKVMGGREAEIMEIVWRNDPVSVAQVHEQLVRREKVAYTTIMTIMSRMAHKGLLNRIRSGNAYVYSPAISREDFHRRVVEGVVDSLVESFAQPAISYFVERLAQQDEAVLAELERLIQKRQSSGREA